MSDFTRSPFVTTRRLTIRYILALGILGLFLGLGNILLQRYITHQKNHALRINMAGQQRMLSQRIALMVHYLAVNVEVDDQKKTQLELLELVNLMARSHQAFITGDVDGKVLPPNPPAVQKLYFESPTNLDQRIKIYLEQARRLAKLPEGQLHIDDSLLYSFHPFEITTLLGILDAVTSEYEKASDDSISFLIFLENLLLSGTIAVLIFVALVIFRPMVRRIQFEVIELRKLSAAVEQSPASVMITNLEGDIEYVNQKFTQVTGYTAEEVLGQNPNIVKSDVQPEEF